MSSLFSFELIVNYLQLDHTKCACLFPSIALRLLDYPTLCIQFLHEIDAKHLRADLDVGKQYENGLPFTHLKELLDTDGRYVFSKGKSCLFRSDISKLRANLNVVPLYLMVIDAYNDPHKLVGATSISLRSLIDALGEELEINSNEALSSKLTHGVFDIKNLMGDEIGYISFAVRISYFGYSLAPHVGITTEALARKKNFAEKVKQSSQVDKKTKSQEVASANTNDNNNGRKSVEIDDRVFDDKNIGTINEEKIVIDYRDVETQFEIFEPIKIENTSKKPPARGPVVNTAKNQAQVNEKVEDPAFFDHYNPPALFYNVDAKSKSQPNKTIIVNKAENAKVSNYEMRRIQYLADAAKAQENRENMYLLSVAEQEIGDGYFLQQSFKSDNNRRSVSFTNEDNFDGYQVKDVNRIEFFEYDNLPRNELKFDNRNNNNRMQAKSARPKSVNKNKKPLNGILKDRNSKKFPLFNKETMIESVNRLSQPRRPGSGKQQQQQLEQQQERPVSETKPKTPRKSTDPPKLMYGLTQTQKMRMLMNRPQKIEEIEEEHEKTLNQLKSNLTQLLIMERSDDVPTKSPHDENKFMSDKANATNNSSLTNKSPFNLSLLNKVEMESTIDYIISKNILNNAYKLSNSDDIKDSFDSRSKKSITS